LSPVHPGTAGPSIENLIEGHRRFLAFVQKRVGDRGVAEELLQSAFVRGLEKIDEVRDPEKTVAWFYRLLRNLIADHFRSLAAGPKEVELEMENEPAFLPEDEAELCGCFEALLPTLEPSYAEILRRVDLGEERAADFARAEGLTANNAMVRLHRARAALRKALQLSCRTCAEHGCLDCSCKGSKV
jgi:RNA polymerase sigma-70 factor (ECF subfamily)